MPAGKVEAGTLISVGEIDGAATHIVLVAGQRRIGYFYNGVVIVLGVESSAPRAGTDESGPRATGAALLAPSMSAAAGGSAAPRSVPGQEGREPPLFLLGGGAPPGAAVAAPAAAGGLAAPPPVPDRRGWGRPPTDCAFEAGETPAAREGRTNEVTPVAAPPNTAPPLPETDESAATGVRGRT